MLKQSDVIELNGDKSNGGKALIGFVEPYSVRFELTGSSDLLFHRWSCEAIAEKAAAAKGSRAKKFDDVETFVWRDDAGDICLPSEYVRMAMIHASKFKQDPRSPRKSAMDLFKAGVASNTEKATLGVKTWDYLDTRRVTIQRNGISRTRPAMKAGWRASFEFQVLLPEYVDQHLFHEVLSLAGRVIGVGDFRPTYGRFAITQFKIS